MSILGRLTLLVGGFSVASAAFVHASSVNGMLPSANAILLSSGLTTQAASELVDRGFRMELARNSQGFADIEPVSEPIATLAKHTVRGAPLDVSTIRTIALGVVLQEDEDRARRLLELAADLSKRDAMTTLWLAQDAGRRGDMAAMMTWFDYALRTSTRARETAISPLVNLLSDPRSFIPLRRLIERRPAWEDSFWREFSRNPVALQAAGDFFRVTSLSPMRMEEGARARLYESLRSAGQLETLLQLADLHPSVPARSTGTFEMAGETNPLDWSLRSDGNFAALVHQGSNELQIDARPGSFGLAAERVVRFTEASMLEVLLAEPLPSGAEVWLNASCANADDGAVASIRLTAGDVAGRAELTRYECTSGTLKLFFRVEPGRRDVLIRVNSIEMART